MNRIEALAQLTGEGLPYELVEIEALGRRVRAFKNAPANLRALYEAGRSDLPFIVYEDERLTFEEAWQASRTLAAVMARDYGVEKGDRVAISMRNYPEWILGFMAATSLGAIAVAMNALWQPHEMAYGLKDSGAKLLLADQERLDRLAACEDVPADLAVIAVRATRTLAPGVRGYDAVMAGADDAAPPEREVGPDDDAIMLYTSGSTGHPKGAVSTHRNILSALLSWELDAQAGMLAGFAPVLGGAQPAALLAIPLFHVSGLHVSLLQCFRAQRRLVCLYKWDPAQAVEIIEREKITGFNGPPAVTGDLVEIARREGRDLSSLIAVGGGGASRAPEQVRAIDRAFPNAAPNTGWGMTETNAIGTSIAGADYLAHPASSGRVSGVLDIRIVDEAGVAQPAGTRGELQIRGASIMRGYWNRPEANAETFVDGWMRTGDVAYVDDEGFVYIVDRIKDLVIRGGENIGCGAVEAALLEHPEIVEASVYGVPDERLGEEVGATLYVRAGLEEAALRSFLEPRLARFEIPRYFHFSDAPLPRIASGKIFKRQLRDEAAQRHAPLLR
ncbi:MULTISPECIES: class I adenylate-forming enzyme family protein [unclassified Caulobacter]|uniref:class I adenylate-forming enzyme family protein n=1 Tax=unclassified Caulobacter TaxID=2648921 RepID=UPI000D349B13|nr:MULTISPECIES: class I adenylate-forming enzyme family protein [unclassified Caulobacter]PTS86161.1 fatty acid--CoA ligase [Caulobacter sp. HMWF009]PTT06289.1 fatty acid--CoA ligase [Caulobacter sp. HMWF025]